MADGILCVLSEPGPVPEQEFHTWYDTEHGPTRMAFPEFSSGLRYRAADGREPSWLAYYALDLDVLDRQEYRRLRSHRSPGEQRIVDRLPVFDRRVYRVITTAGEAGAQPPAILACVALTSSDDQGLTDWYDREHLPLLQAIPGWRRTVRGRLVAGTGPAVLAVHEIDDPDVFSTDAYRAATSTPWRERVMAQVTCRERRVFHYHNTIATPPPTAVR